MNKPKQNRAVFLDRDGVINVARVVNGKPYPPQSLQDFKFLPGVNSAIDKLKKMGFVTIIVTNQPDVSTGKQSKRTVMEIHDLIMKSLSIDDIKVCFCKGGPNCHCYKPSPEMLIESADKWNINLIESYMVGDRWRDIGAGSRAGCTTVLIDYKYKEKIRYKPDYVVESLVEAANLISECEMQNFSRLI